MRYKRVSKIDYNFSVLGFGCWGASGNDYWTNHGDKEQIKAIHTAIDFGVNFFDVAPIYGCGHAEEVLGKAIKGHRDKLFIATKVGVPWGADHVGYNDVSEKNIMKEIDMSLKRLNIDYVDLYQVHWPTDKGVPLEETIGAMKKIKESGKAKYIGLSNFSVEDYQRANEIVEIVSMQGLFNMLEHNADSYHTIPLQYRVKDEVFPLVKNEGLAFFPYSPLLQGLLTGKITEDTVFGPNDVRNHNPKLQGNNRIKHLNALKRICVLDELQGKTVAEIAMSYLVAQDEVTSVIATQANSDEVIMNVKSLEWQMSKDIIDVIDKIVKEELED